MKISKDKVVTLNYTLTEGEEVLETSDGREPLMYIHGSGGLIKGFEAAMEGRSPKDTFGFTVSPEDGYGVPQEHLIFQAAREQFQQIPELTIGMPLRVQTPEGAMVVRIAEVHDDHVLLDANHPLSGKTLTFNVEVLEVRDATAEELEDAAQAEEAACGCESAGSCGSSCGTSCGEGCCS
jgi:FKBP-type peptidyl-prolyl cis-trans isomerase SlyD